jgi:hypothetical protein
MNGNGLAFKERGRLHRSGSAAHMSGGLRMGGPAGIEDIHDCEQMPGALPASGAPIIAGAAPNIGNYP